MIQVISYYLRLTVWVNWHISPISGETFPYLASRLARNVGEGIGPQLCARLVQSAVQLTACGKGQETVTVTTAGVSGGRHCYRGRRQWRTSLLPRPTSVAEVTGFPLPALAGIYHQLSLEVGAKSALQIPNIATIRENRRTSEAFVKIISVLRPRRHNAAKSHTPCCNIQVKEGIVCR